MNLKKKNDNAIKRGPNPNHYLYKGDNASYISLHGWVRRHKIDPKECEHCGDKKVKLQWANKSHEYKRQLDDWIRLCIPCHRKYDLDENGNKRKDTKKYGLCGGDRKNGKLTNDQIIDIFLSTESQPFLAEKYGVNQNYISRIQSRVRAARITKHLESPIRKLHSEILTPEQVLSIFNSIKEQKQIAVDYGVSPMAVSSIKRGRTWREVTGKTFVPAFKRKKCV